MGLWTKKPLELSKVNTETFAKEVSAFQGQKNMMPVAEMTGPLKYRLVDAEEVRMREGGSTGRIITQKLHRIEALIDIPMWGVKAGDKGGFVSGYDILSHQGSCWISGNAWCVGNVRITHNALIADEALVKNLSDEHRTITVSDNATVFGKGTVLTSRSMDTNTTIDGDARIYGNALAENCSHIGDSTEIFDDAVVDSCAVRFHAVVREKAYAVNSILVGHANLSGQCRIYEAIVRGDTSIAGNVVADAGCTFQKTNNIFGTITFPRGRVIENYFSQGNQSINEKKEAVQALGNMYQKFNIGSREEVNTDSYKNATVTTEQKVLSFEAQGKPSRSLSKPQASLLYDTVENIEKEYNDYTDDIIKLIKYPLMTDSTFAPVAVFRQKLRKLKRRISMNTDLTEESVDDLEQAYLAMEAACVLTATHNLDSEKKKKLKTASQLVTIALDESSSEQEKESSAKKALDYLAGVVLVPERTVDSFRIRAGLLELEA